MEDKLEEIIKLLKGIDEKLEVLVNQKKLKSSNPNKEVLLKQFEETEKLKIVKFYSNHCIKIIQNMGINYVKGLIY